MARLAVTAVTAAQQFDATCHCDVDRSRQSVQSCPLNVRKQLRVNAGFFAVYVMDARVESAGVSHAVMRVRDNDAKRHGSAA